MVIELTLAEDILGEVAKSGDTIILKNDGTYTIKKEFADYKNFAACEAANKDKEDTGAYCGAIKHKVENVEKADQEPQKIVSDSSEKKPWAKEKIKDHVLEDYIKDQEKETKKEFDPRIEKYLTDDQEKAWSILSKLYINKHFDSTKVLKHVITKMAVCPDITEKFDELMTKWMAEGEADISSIEKIIESCKKEGGNVKKSVQEKIIKETQSSKCKECGHENVNNKCELHGTSEDIDRHYKNPHK